jgi:hypothetical protein
LQEALLLLRRLVSGARHLVHDLLEIDIRVGFERREQRGRERGMGACQPVERLRAELGGGDQQKPLHRAGLDAVEGQLLALEVWADVTERIVAAGIED